MSSTTLLRGLVAALTATALLVPTAAHAGKSVHRDAVGDVVSMSMEDESEELTPAPDQKRGDVTRTVANHRAKRVTFKVKMRELPRRASMHGISTRIITKQRSYSLDIFRPGFGKDAILSTRRGKVIECEGLSHARNDKRRTVSFSVPRSCLGDPRWVRLGAGVFHISNGTKAFLDESHRDGLDRPRNIAVGPKVRRS
jgi:hypothetical protein